MYDLIDYELRFQEEIYDGLQYQQLRPHFHAFESSKCMVGFSFCDESAAQSFASKVEWSVKSVHEARGEDKKGPLLLHVQCC